MTQDNIKSEYPPNYQDILMVFGDVSVYKPVFAYYPNIYNPFGRDLTPDVVHHEEVHLRQQKDIGVDVWYNKYLHDAGFRLKQELEAYSEQYLWSKENIERKADELMQENKKIPNYTEMMNEYLESLATELSGAAYGHLLTFNQAKTGIRKYGRT